MEATYKRVPSTEDMDYYTYYCGGCNDDMGCNSPTPYLHTEDFGVLCIACGIRAGVDSFSIDSESCFDDDSLLELITGGLWESAYDTGFDKAKADEEYKTNYQKFRDGKWDETKLGPFHVWADTRQHPFIVEAYKNLMRKLKDATENKNMANLLEALIEDSKHLEYVGRVDAALAQLKRVSAS